jgi:hypothetical protein
MSQAAVRRMVPRRRGVIVTVASNAAHTPRTGMAAYAASKAAASMFTKSLGLEVARYGIRCNVVAPGSTDTPLLRRLERLRFSSLSGRASVAQHNQIIALCKEGDVEGAAAATRANWETLAHLIDYTGGFTEEAYTNRVYCTEIRQPSGASVMCFTRRVKTWKSEMAISSGWVRFLSGMKTVSVLTGLFTDREIMS